MLHIDETSHYNKGKLGWCWMFTNHVGSVLTNRQICWAHLARDFERFAHSTHMGIKTLGYGLKKVATELFALAKAFLKDKKIDSLDFLATF